MQTTRFLVVIGAVAALSASPLQSYAGPDNEAQAKMREALRQKMEALNTQAAPAPSPAPAPKPAEVKPAAPPAPTVVVPVPVEPEPVKVVAPKPAPVAAPAKASSGFSEVLDSGDTAAEAKLREALRQKIVAEPAAPAVVVVPAKPAKPAAPAKPVVTVTSPAPAPAPTSVVAQPVPAKVEPAIAPALPASKTERLAVLLQQYKADQITPQQYHAQRAAIIAEP